MVTPKHSLSVRKEPAALEMLAVHASAPARGFGLKMTPRGTARCQSRLVTVTEGREYRAGRITGLFDHALEYNGAFGATRL